MGLVSLVSLNDQLKFWCCEVKILLIYTCIHTMEIAGVGLCVSELKS